jgi:hypothetical protein
MATDNTLVAKYLQRGVVRQRNSVTLAEWAAFIAAEAIPSPVTADWVRQRVVGESIPLQLDSFTTQTMAFFMQDPGTVSDILQFISEDNDTPTEETLSTTNASICSTFMPRFALSTVTNQEVTDWCTQNNVPVPSTAPPPPQQALRGRETGTTRGSK